LPLHRRGGGETLWVWQGKVVARSLLCFPASEAEARRNTWQYWRTTPIYFSTSKLDAHLI
jgi:hypothetical protein